MASTTLSLDLCPAKRMIGLAFLSTGRRRWIGGFVFALFVLVTLGHDLRLLAGEGAIGTADNTGFYRVMGPLGLDHILEPGQRRDWVTLHTDFRRYFAAAPVRNYQVHSVPTTTVVRVILWIYHQLLPDRSFFDISALGLAYLVLAVVAIASLVANRRVPVSLLIAAALLTVVSDPEHIVLLNTFYFAPTAFVALLGLVCVVCRPTRTLTTVTAAAVLAFVLSFTQVQLAASGLVLLTTMLLGRLVRRRHRRPARRRVFGHRGGTLAWVLLGACAIAPIAVLAKDGNPTARVNRFNALFDGVLRSTSAERTLDVLTQLKVDLALKDLAGQGYYELCGTIGAIPRSGTSMKPEDWERVCKLEEAQWMHVSAASLLAIYLTDAPTAAEFLDNSTRNLTRHDPTRLSNYARGQHPNDDSPDYYRPNYPRISWLREQLVTLRWPWFAVMAVAVVLAVGRGVSRAPPERTGYWLALLFLVLFGLSQPLVAVLGDGYWDFARHLFVARFALDLAVGIALALAVDAVVRRLPWWRSGAAQTPTQ
jgi:hypothetical protein